MKTQRNENQKKAALAQPSELTNLALVSEEVGNEGYLSPFLFLNLKCGSYFEDCTSLVRILNRQNSLNQTPENIIIKKSLSKEIDGNFTSEQIP